MIENDENMEKIDVVANYGDTIRQMIKNEDEVRNQRTNWFLIIQGFLIAGLCDLSSSGCIKNYNNKALVVFIIIIGIVTSISFLFAAWRSSLAINFALSCWKDRLGNDSEEKYPPVSLITKEILEARGHSSDSWKNRIYNRMYERKNECRKCLDDHLNKMDRLLPYKILPIIFLLGWLGYAIFINCFLDIN